MGSYTKHSVALASAPFGSVHLSSSVVSRSFTVFAASAAPTDFAISMSIASRNSALPPKYESVAYGLVADTSATTCFDSVLFWSPLSFDRSSAVRMSQRLARQESDSVAYSVRVPKTLSYVPSEAPFETRLPSWWGMATTRAEPPAAYWIVVVTSFSPTSYVTEVPVTALALGARSATV